APRRAAGEWERRSSERREGASSSPLESGEERLDLGFVVADQEGMDQREHSLDHPRNLLGRKVGEKLAEDPGLLLEHLRDRFLEDREELGAEAPRAGKAGGAHRGPELD